MNNYATEARRRGRSLLVVEGDHEKNELFWLVFKCYPELHVDMENIWIYGTNIYMLYEDIIREYMGMTGKMNGQILTFRL